MWKYTCFYLRLGSCGVDTHFSTKRYPDRSLNEGWPIWSILLLNQESWKKIPTTPNQAGLQSYILFMNATFTVQLEEKKWIFLINIFPYSLLIGGFNIAETRHRMRVVESVIIKNDQLLLFLSFQYYLVATCGMRYTIKKRTATHYRSYCVKWWQDITSSRNRLHL